MIYGEGKTAEQIVGICRHLSAAGAANILIIQLDPEKAAAVCHCVAADYDPVSRIAVGAPRKIELVGRIAVATGGTSDMPVAEEDRPGRPRLWAAAWSGCTTWAWPDCIGCCPSWINCRAPGW